MDCQIQTETKNTLCNDVSADMLGDYEKLLCSHILNHKLDSEYLMAI